MTEEQALALLKRREQAGLAYFIERYTAYVSTIIWNIIGQRLSVQDAEELTSDVFLALWENGAKPRPGKVKAYVGSIARCKAISRLRANGFALALEDDDLPLSQDDPARLLETRELAAAVRQAVQGMDWPDQEIFIRHYYYCQKTAAIAEEMALTDAAVRQRLRRGRERLKQEFTKGGLYCDK